MVPDTMPSLPLSNNSLPVLNPPAIPGPFYICSAFYTDTESTRDRCDKVTLFRRNMTWVAGLPSQGVGAGHRNKGST